MVVIVVVLLFINIYALTLLVGPILPDGNGDEEEPTLPLHAWNVTVDARVIEEDETWTGIDGPLGAPVVVKDGATLRLVDCHIQLLCEDFILFRQPYFTVEHGGALELEGSSVELVYDPWLDTTLVGPTYGTREYPYLSRVVNLTGTEAPEISFDVKWKRGGTRLNVAVQPIPGGDLVNLDTVKPTGAPSDWLHYIVPLYDYIGSEVNVVLFFPDFPDDVLFIHDLLVTDGGEILPNDLPLLDSGLMPYWKRSYFITSDNAFRWYLQYSQVIQAEGEVVVSNSIIASDPVYRWGDSSYSRGKIWPFRTTSNVWASTRNWDISVEGAGLRVLNSTLEQMPVRCIDSRLEVDSSHFESGYDVFTLFGSAGSFSDSTFSSEGPSDALPSWGEDVRPLWAISADNNTANTPVSIRGCTFEGTEQAMNLGNAVVTVVDCTFRDVTRLAVWNHDPAGTLSWDQLKADNAFRDCQGFLYLQTRETTIELNASERSGWSIDIYDLDGEEITDFDLHPDVPKYLLTMDGTRGSILNPQMLVESTDSVRFVDRVNVSMTVEIHDGEDLDGRINFSVRPVDDIVRIDAYPLLKDQEVNWWDTVSAPIDLEGISWNPMYGTAGTYHAWWRVYLRNLFAYNVTFDAYIDGVQEVSFNESDVVDLIGGSYLKLEMDILLEVGVHRLDLVVTGQVLDENLSLAEEPSTIENYTCYLARVDSSTPVGEARAVLNNDGAYLLLDPGTDMEVEDLEPASEVSDPWIGHIIHVVGAENATFTLRNTDFGGRANLSIYYQDLPDLRVIGSAFEYFHLMRERSYVENLYADAYETTHIHLDNMTCTFLNANINMDDLEVHDVIVNGTLYVHGSFSLSITMPAINCRLDSMHLGGQTSTFVLENSTLSSDYGYGLVVSIHYNATMTVRNCTFDGAWLYISRNTATWIDWEVTVTDCLFTGDGAYLAMLWTMSPAGWKTSPASFQVPLGGISNNTFSGNVTGILLHHRLYGAFLGENRFEDGASMWAWYMTQVSAACSDPSVGGYSEAILRMLPNEFPLTFGLNDWPKENEVILELHDGPSSALNPPGQVALLTWIERQYYGTGMVMGSGVADLTKDQNLLYHMYWPDLRWALVDAIEPWPIPMDFELED